MKHVRLWYSLAVIAILAVACIQLAAGADGHESLSKDQDWRRPSTKSDLKEPKLSEVDENQRTMAIRRETDDLKKNEEERKRSSESETKPTAFSSYVAISGSQYIKTFDTK